MHLGVTERSLVGAGNARRGDATVLTIPEPHSQLPAAACSAAMRFSQVKAQT
jgi:hypothetical protein